jgi:hypothetical protein
MTPEATRQRALAAAAANRGEPVRVNGEVVEAVTAFSALEGWAVTGRYRQGLPVENRIVGKVELVSGDNADGGGRDG